jgi:acetylornithine deacetylase
MMTQLQDNALKLLKELIKIQSFSKEEDGTADLLEKWFADKEIVAVRNRNNVWAVNKYFDADKPTLLLNSHHDTVKPNAAYTRDPFLPTVEDGKLYGLGSNDAGGCLVGLLAAFSYFYEKENLAYNLVIAATAEEENSGENGIAFLLPFLPKIDVAIVGEPTLLDLAIAEKGLVVLDAVVKGTPGHAAHTQNTENPINMALQDLSWFDSFQFPKLSEALGAVKMTVTQINAGSQHNVVPAELHFVVDVRVTDAYTNQEVLDLVQAHSNCEIKARSLRLNSSSIDPTHPLVKAGVKLGKNTYGSPTLSDQSRLTCQSLKLGPGDSLRSHSADEFIYVQEVMDGVEFYIKLLKEVV